MTGTYIRILSYPQPKEWFSPTYAKIPLEEYCRQAIKMAQLSAKLRKLLKRLDKSLKRLSPFTHTPATRSYKSQSFNLSYRSAKLPGDATTSTFSLESIKKYLLTLIKAINSLLRKIIWLTEQGFYQIIPIIRSQFNYLDKMFGIEKFLELFGLNSINNSINFSLCQTNPFSKS